jgi:NADH-quinone oxidoreductase subunit A
MPPTRERGYCPPRTIAYIERVGPARIPGSVFFLARFVKFITKSEGWQVSPDFDLSTYYPIFAYLVVLLLFAVGVMVATHMIGPNNRTAVKQMPYESGMDPIGDARQRFDVKFYLVAIMFLVFDVELLFLYPWAVVAYRDDALPGVLRGPVFWCVLTFILLLFVAYVYDWKKGVFKWR